VPRLKARVKNKSVSRSLRATGKNSTGSTVSTRLTRALPGPIDLHFHGALGVDFMTADEALLDELCHDLGQRALSGFCATTLSVEASPLAETVSRLGPWIRKIHDRLSEEKSARDQGALPLGIHLEGPFLSPEARGAHPPGAIRALHLAELDSLWELSRGTLKILTVAPETLSPDETRRLALWCKIRKIHLSLGHSRATETQARDALDAGFTGITHAWNAMPFHHREPGPLGAALGRKGVAVELIVDEVHVHPTVLRWTEALHQGAPLCWISDGAPAAGLPEGQPTAFGPLRIHSKDGACRIINPDGRDGGLAGGGLLLPDCFARQVTLEAARTGIQPERLITRFLPHVSRHPQKTLAIPAGSALGRALNRRRVRWRIGPAARRGQLAAISPIAQFL